MSREDILHKTRTALGRAAGQAPEPVPDARIVIPEAEIEARIEAFFCALGKLAGKTYLAASPADARGYVEAVTGGSRAVASGAPLLAECGITSLPGVESGFETEPELRAACADAAFGITSATYALCDTGTLVIFSSCEEPRLVSLLPPAHIAVISRERILTGLDELLSLAPLPAETSSSMLMITGPSRTADIEQILIRGVHGPGEIHVVVV